MKLQEVTIRYARKANLGNYQTADAEIILGATVEEGEDLDKALTGLWLMAWANVAYALGHAVGKPVDHDLGLPGKGGDNES